MRKNLKNQKGLTLMEILIVLAVLGIIIATVMFQFSKTRANQVFQNGIADVLSALDKARGDTLSSLNSSTYGVHFQSNQVVIFKGTVYNSGASDNQVITIVTPANITNVTFGGVSGNSGDIYFNRLSGSPSTTGTITLVADDYSKTITISATGVASTN